MFNSQTNKKKNKNHKQHNIMQKNNNWTYIDEVKKATKKTNKFYT